MASTTGEEVGATAIAYRPRGGGRLVQLRPGDLSQPVVAGANLSQLALPRAEGES